VCTQRSPRPCLTPPCTGAGRENTRSGRLLGTHARSGRTSSEKRKLPRHVCITADADTIADRERQRGRHPVPDDMLLAPGTDNLERGSDCLYVHARLGFMRRISLMFHYSFPSPMAIDSKTPQRSRPAQLSSDTACALKLPARGEEERSAHREKHIFRMFLGSTWLAVYARSRLASRMYTSSPDVVELLRGKV
jgi:hypothetical protein